MLRHGMVSDKPGGLSLQPPPSPGKLAAQLNSPFGDSFYKCLQMFYICFIMRLRESFNSRFQEGFTIHIKKTRRYSFVDDISQALFPPLSRSSPGGEGARAHFPKCKH